MLGTDTSEKGIALTRKSRKYRPFRQTHDDRSPDSNFRSCRSMSTGTREDAFCRTRVARVQIQMPQRSRDHENMGLHEIQSPEH